jgi:hypothetical protein
MARRTRRGGIAAKRPLVTVETHVVHVTSFCDDDSRATERALYAHGQAQRKRVKVAGALPTHHRHDMQALLRYI